MTNRWLLQPGALFSQSPIIPVIVLHDLASALPLAKALISGGINVLEITLRTPAALAAIRLLRQEIPEALVGAGTVTSVLQLRQCIEAGAQFAISPGLTRELLQAAWEEDIPFIPGAASISELMEGMAVGYRHFKFFPAEALGGLTMLKAIHGPFPELCFCATGGVNEKNFLDYLSLPNVECVGGSWIVPNEAIKQKSWYRITELAIDARAQVTSF
ncbi:2-deydro-3-deoxyphosphogluconate aldolase/4-hydroxy-2-oxoglutarate aldolase [Legionella lansingensis]|uniref:2-dehydro-3-deoxy-phosphogluconate aldolase n=2 Tax=Legionella lansingensis TaxID=45067 RepID=A0A0W0VTZ8_9GAMM|nr:bifunctional 4-hydroxy-2-oxoglutarate aldolase/2-dehydro-3-deoxy-phosphogluconate aldolase [Legionella lansingensis]KTD23461.1 2-deydro-3-deoxyphosphogluconate aldolase/4-hydroxy-2-oxoglutarate aldolase [Legionella lansingensis]SNV50837.1 2-deydro-3-deoxyphosphogluconate aldolase/4-hydroxy-2-oxoglutarate aldolase [Legionella lansingensis]